MSIRGVFASHSALIGERMTDLSARVLMTGPGGMSPLLALSAGMPKESATNTSFSWIEDEHISGNQAVVTGGNSAATSLVMDDLGIWTTNTILLNQNTGEYLMVTALNTSTNTITVTRGFAGTTAATVTAADKLQSIGTAYEEGGGKPDPVSQKGSELLNYVQIFKNGWSITGTAQAVKYLTGNQLANNRQLCFAYHSEDIERAFIWGRKALTTLNGKQLRLSNGVLAQIEGYGGNVATANTGSTAGNLSLKDLFHWLRLLFDVQVKGMPNERIAFCGSGVLEKIQQMALLDGMYQLQPDSTSYGIQVTTLRGFNGQLKLVTHPLMVENAVWQNEIYVLHPGLISKRVLRETWTEEFGPSGHTNNGIDATEGYIADELGFQVKGAKTMGIYRNIQTAVKSN